ncbi:DUF4856 domain-containing protein [Winogradskyella endarachnes]|uniref:DUF4856 domain-containing protein n=1 Tax=Winogradskyella endarachnes TaxID=2681965 RepID=A0A6L6UFP9_9FLAO|nr:DUF4856 domain-containing protein [Winogradskyella endarachnes]MUU79792.1 DUF4856 domain-containing protein [Winogradskyella endarachnes]
MKKIVLSLLVVGAILTSCSSDDDNGTTEPQVEAPATYQFERNGITTVNYGGQTTRIEMGEELVSALSDASKSEAELDGMFTNTGDYFSTSELNTSGKDIRSKTAASTDYFSANTTDATAIKAQFDAWIASQVSEVFPNWNTDAVAGTAGKIQEAGGGSTRYVSAKGVEFNQAITKGLIGGLMADQILNNYLSTAVLDAGNNVEDNDNDVLDGTNNYTTMEHKWDEAFGYLYGVDDALAPQLNVDSFLNKYLSRVEGDDDFAGIAQDIYDAFKLGRAAIVAKNYEVRDEQAAIIREKISIVIGVRAVYYLQAGKAGLGSDYASVFHDLSEGLGFVYSLQFTRQPGTDVPYLSKTEVDAFMSELLEGNGFWDVTTETLDSISEDIADRFSFTVTEAAS